MSYEQAYQASLSDPESYWAEQARALSWFKAPEQLLGKTDHGTYNWFSDGELNISYLALDVQIAEGRGDQVALYYDSPVTQTKEAITYKVLLQQVELLPGDAAVGRYPR